MTASQTIGSNLFRAARAVREHLMRSEFGRELKDLRTDVQTALHALPSACEVEFTNPAAQGVAVILAAKATSAVVQTYAADDLDGTVADAELVPPRLVTVSTAGDTPASAGATATITGLDPDGVEQTEDIAIPQTAATATGTKFFSQITGVEFTAGSGTDATISVGLNKVMLLPRAPLTKAGLVPIYSEITNGAVPTLGTIDATTHGYTPNVAQDGSKDYYLVYAATPATLGPPVGV